MRRPAPGAPGAAMAVRGPVLLSCVLLLLVLACCCAATPLRHRRAAPGPAAKRQNPDEDQGFTDSIADFMAIMDVCWRHLRLHNLPATEDNLAACITMTMLARQQRAATAAGRRKRRPFQPHIRFPAPPSSPMGRYRELEPSVGKPPWTILCWLLTRLDQFGEPRRHATEIGLLM